MVRTAAVMTALAIGGCGPSVPMDPGAETSTTRTEDDGEGSPTSLTATTASSTAGEATGTTSTSTSTSTGTSTSTSTTQDSRGDAMDDALLPPDQGSCFSVCITCDLWAQDCQKGQKCMPWADDGGSVWNDSECTPIAETPGAPGDPCFVEGSPWSGIDDCQINSMCWDVDLDTNAGTCVGVCIGSEANPVCDGGAHCFTAYDGWINLCLPPCEPLVPSCDTGLACVASAIVVPDVFACVPESLVADRSQYADPCDDVIGCGTGLLCTVPEDVPGCAGECCTMLCDPLAANVCPDAAMGQVCIAHEDTPTLGHCGVL